MSDGLFEEGASLAGPELGDQLETKPPENEYTELLQEADQAEQTQLKQSLYLGVQKTPDAFKEVVDLAKEFRLPLAVVEGNKEELAQKSKLRLVDPKSMLEVAPKTAAFLMDPANAGLSHDDIDQLIRNESAFMDLGKGRLGSAGAGVMRGAGGMLTETVKAVATSRAEGARYTLMAFDAIDRGESAVRPGQPTPNIPLSREYALASEERRAEMRTELKRQMDPREHAAWELGKVMQEGIEKFYTTNPLYADEFLAGKLPQGFGSMLGFMVGTALFRTPVMAGFMGAAVQHSTEFEQAINSGATIEEAIEAAGWNALMGYSEAVPIGRILDRVDKVAQGGVKKAMLELMKGGVEEGLQEFLQTVWTNLVASDIVKYDPDRKMFEGSWEGTSVGFTVGALTQALMALLLGRRAGPIQPPPNSQDQSKLDELHDIGKNTKTLERAPEAYREHLQQLQEEYGPDEMVYIPAQDIQALAREGMISPEMSPAMGQIFEQMPEAIELGGDVTVSVADYVADIASKEELADHFRPIVRLAPDTLSLREAQQLDQAEPLRAIEEVEKAARSVKTDAEVAAVMEDVIDQLVTSGRVTEHQARVNANVIGAYVATKAKKEGRPVQEVFESMGLQIQGRTSGKAVPDQLYAPQQDFQGVTLTETFSLAETGEKVTTKRQATEAWEKAQARRTEFEELVECLYG